MNRFIIHFVQAFTLTTPYILPIFPIYTHNKQREREREIPSPRLVSLNIITLFMYSFCLEHHSADQSVYNSLFNKRCLTYKNLQMMLQMF